MTVQESQDWRLPPDIPESQRTGQQIQCPFPSSNWDVPADHSGTPNTLVYTETDYLLPVALYGISRARRSTRAPDAGAAVETVCSMLLQISVPFLLAGLGTVFTGLLLEVVQVRGEKNVDTDSKEWAETDSVEENLFAYKFLKLFSFSGRHPHTINSEIKGFVIFINIESRNYLQKLLGSYHRSLSTVSQFVRGDPDLHTHNLYVPPCDVGSRFHPPLQLFVLRYLHHICSWSSQIKLLRPPISHYFKHSQTL